MLKFIETIAREAGAMALAEMDHLDHTQISCKKSAADLVTSVDRKIEIFLKDKIQTKFSGHDFFGEESGRDSKNSRFCWVVDPIDGTTSYIHGHPFFSISIALQENRRTVAGAVYGPKLQEMFLAERGRGAFLNGRKLKVSAAAALADSLLATGFACVRDGKEENNLRYFNRLLPRIRGIRRCGSAALDLAYVACGRLDGYWELSLNLYDVAAGTLLVEEAGGKISDMSGGKFYPESGIAATNGLIHDALLNYFRPAAER